jgi:hypothetical protein
MLPVAMRIYHDVQQVLVSQNFYWRKMCFNENRVLFMQVWWWNNMASVRVGWCVQAISDTSEISKIQCSAI